VRGGHFPPPPVLGDVGYYIQRGATIQTYRELGACSPGGATLGVAVPIGTLVAAPFIIGLDATLDRIGFNCTVGAAGSSARVGVYRSTSPRNVYPGALVVDSGAISTVANGWKEANIATRLAPGLYWRVYLAGVLAPTVSTLGPAATPTSPILGYSAANPPTPFNSLRVAFAFAALPATFPGGAALNVGSPVFISGRFSA